MRGGRAIERRIDGRRDGGSTASPFRNVGNFFQFTLPVSVPLLVQLKYIHCRTHTLFAF